LSQLPTFFESIYKSRRGELKLVGLARTTTVKKIVTYWTSENHGREKKNFVYWIGMRGCDEFGGKISRRGF